MFDRTLFSPYAKSDYRNDIQGIRTLSAVIIMIYHIWLSKVSGGVDVFFVISGFLMGGVLLRQVGRQGAFSFWGFWGRAVLRITPSAYFVLLCTTFLAVYFLPSPLWEGFIDEVLYSSLHLENYKLIDVSTDYLSRDEPPSPVQQFWALSVQIQFLIIFPFVFFLGAWWSSKKNNVNYLKNVLLFVILLSFTYSIYITSVNPSAAYFSVFARFWEFLVGAYVALIVFTVDLQFTKTTKNIVSLLALVLFFLMGLIIPSTLKFPGYISLVPVAIAVIFILIGSSKDTFVYRFLSFPVFVRLGAFSFTIYLWHWPILVFAQHYLWTTELSLPQGFGVIALAILCAYITNFVIERGVKRLEISRVFTMYIVGAGCFLPVFLFGFLWQEDISELKKEARNAKYVVTENYEKLIDPELFYSNNLIAAEKFIAIKERFPSSYRSRCHQDMDKSAPIYCEYGDTDSGRSVVLVGGSHAAQWLPIIDHLGKKYHFKVINITKMACPLGFTYASNPSCVEWNRLVIDAIVEHKPLLVFASSTRTYDDDVEGVPDLYVEAWTKPSDDVLEDVPDMYVEAWTKIISRNLRVIGIRDNPRFPFDVPTCLAQHSRNMNKCSIERNKVLSAVDPSLIFTQSLDGFETIDMSNTICDKTFCHGYYDNMIIYRDSNHLSPDYVLNIGREFEMKLKKIVPELLSSG
jgi:peptidoglycan/LPS O-acetylase OafA/YrhL